MSDKKKILIVDDEPDQREYLATILEDNGFETASAQDGIEGFAIAGKGDIALITLDISMDNQSGIKMYKTLRETEGTKSIPVIVVTGVSPDLKGFFDRNKLGPPDAFFEKPVDRQNLIDKIKELIG